MHKINGEKRDIMYRNRMVACNSHHYPHHDAHTLPLITYLLCIFALSDGKSIICISNRNSKLKHFPHIIAHTCTMCFQKKKKWIKMLKEECNGAHTGLPFPLNFWKPLWMPPPLAWRRFQAQSHQQLFSINYEIFFSFIDCFENG